MFQRVRHEVRDDLSDALRVAIDRARKSYSSLNRYFADSSKLADHLFEVIKQRSIGVALKEESTPKSSLRKIERVIDQARHSLDAILHVLANCERFFIRFAAQKQVYAGVNGSERIAEIVSKNGDELLAQICGLARIQ